MVVFVWAFAGWIAVSLIATPFIGRFLRAADAERGGARLDAPEQSIMSAILPLQFEAPKRVVVKRPPHLRLVAR
jgi:hypothetical protein